VHDEGVAVGADDGLKERGNQTHSGAFTQLPIVAGRHGGVHRLCVGSTEGIH
jgi:hypothetical protein